MFLHYEESRMKELIQEQLYYNGVNIKFDDFKNTVEYYFKNDLLMIKNNILQ